MNETKRKKMEEMGTYLLKSAATKQAEAEEQRTNGRLGRRVGKNALWLLISRLGAQGLMIVFTLVIARRMGQEGLGGYAFIAAVIFLGNTVTTFGTDMLIIREVAAGKGMNLLPAGLIVQLVLSIIFIGATFSLAPRLPNQDPQTVLALEIFSLALIPMAFYTIFSAVMRGYERMDLFTWVNLGLASLYVGLAWMFIQPTSSLTRLTLLLVAAQSLGAILAGGLCFAYFPSIRRVWRASLPAILSLVRLSAPIAALGLLKVLYQRSDIYLLTAMAGAAATGWYSAALRILEASQVGHIAVLGALFPVMSRFQPGEASPAGGRQILRVSWLGLLALGIGLAAALFVLAPTLIPWLYGADFEPSILAMRILAWLMIPYSINIYLSSRLISSRQERKVALALALSLTALVGLNVWWIPVWGLYGACLATVASEIIQAAGYLFLERSGPQLTKNSV
jgi:O-antigen/teichoic acid export membrane protein